MEPSESSRLKQSDIGRIEESLGCSLRTIDPLSGLNGATFRVTSDRGPQILKLFSKEETRQPIVYHQVCRFRDESSQWAGLLLPEAKIVEEVNLAEGRLAVVFEDLGGQSTEGSLRERAQIVRELAQSHVWLSKRLKQRDEQVDALLGGEVITDLSNPRVYREVTIEAVRQLEIVLSDDKTQLGHIKGISNKVLHSLDLMDIILPTIPRVLEHQDLSVQNILRIDSPVSRLTVLEENFSPIDGGSYTLGTGITDLIPLVTMNIPRKPHGLLLLRNYLEIRPIERFFDLYRAEKLNRMIRVAGEIASQCLDRDFAPQLKGLKKQLGVMCALAVEAAEDYSNEDLKSLP